LSPGGLLLPRALAGSLQQAATEVAAAAAATSDTHAAAVDLDSVLALLVARQRAALDPQLPGRPDAPPPPPPSQLLSELVSSWKQQAAQERKPLRGKMCACYCVRHAASRFNALMATLLVLTA
jgi:hypothetical protein